MAKNKKIVYDPMNMQPPEPEALIEEPDFTRQTFVIRRKHLNDIKTAAYWKRITQKELLDKILEDYFKKNKPKEIE